MHHIPNGTPSYLVSQAKCGMASIAMRVFAELISKNKIFSKLEVSIFRSKVSMNIINMSTFVFRSSIVSSKTLFLHRNDYVANINVNEHCIIFVSIQMFCTVATMTKLEGGAC